MSMTSTVTRRATVAKPRPAQNGAPPSSATAEAPAVMDRKAPWAPVTTLKGKQGWIVAIFGPPGSGKSTLVAEAARVEAGKELLIVNFDGELKSLEDRDDLMVWPGPDTNKGVIKDWPMYKTFSTQIRSRTHPFKTFQFDTINSMYDLAYQQALKTAGANRDPRHIFGIANDLVIGEIDAWKTYGREKGYNVIFVCHSEEKQDGENGPLMIRMQVTPGVVKAIMQKVSTVGCLLVVLGKRKLYLHNTARIIAKHHQPQTGDQLPLEISEPNFGRILEHVRGIRKYPPPAKKEPAK